MLELLRASTSPSTPCPRSIEFRDELPKTLVGKVAYRVLEEEEQAKHAAEAPAAPAEEGK